MKIIYTLTILIVISGCTPTESLEGPFKVTKVTDGDTIQINFKQTIRLSGINSPEKDDCHYEKSKDYLKDLILGKEIYLEKDYTNKGRYGRLLRYVHLGKEDINAKLIHTGNAKVYDKYASTTKKYSELKDLEYLAKQKNLGVWNCNVAVNQH